MEKYNFDTRELVPYREDWNRGGRHIKICGALWYIKEEDSIFIVSKENAQSNPQKHPIQRYRIAKGLPAALLAQGDALVQTDFDIIGCYQAYFKEAEKSFPTKPTSHLLTILEDWEYTIEHSRIISHNTSGFVDNYALMRIALFLRAKSNPYCAESIDQKISHNYYYTCLFNGKSEAQLVFSKMPMVENRSEAPFIYVHDLGQIVDTSNPQASGFMAAIINLAIYHHWERRWMEYNFTDDKVIRNIIQAYKEDRPILDIFDVNKLSFDLPYDVTDICKAYMASFEPIMRKVWKMNPKVQLACTEGDDIYTYIYKHEIDSPEQFFDSELYANLTHAQRQTITGYGLRFLEWMRKTYPISPASQVRVINAMASDMSPVQVTIKNDVKITRAVEKEEKPKKKQNKIPKATEEAICPYINADVLAEKGNYTVEQFQRMLRQACEQEAKVLVKFLIQHKKYENLDFHGASMKAIYITLRKDCFPTMKDYSYQNFAAAWKAEEESLPDSI